LYLLPLNELGSIPLHIEGADLVFSEIISASKVSNVKSLALIHFVYLYTSRLQNAIRHRKGKKWCVVELFRQSLVNYDEQLQVL